MNKIKTKESEKYKNTFKSKFNNLCTLYIEDESNSAKTLCNGVNKR